jgi:hypothetical protein
MREQQAHEFLAGVTGRADDRHFLRIHDHGFNRELNQTLL